MQQDQACFIFWYLVVLLYFTHDCFLVYFGKFITPSWLQCLSVTLSEEQIWNVLYLKSPSMYSCHMP